MHLNFGPASAPLFCCAHSDPDCHGPGERSCTTESRQENDQCEIGRSVFLDPHPAYFRGWHINSDKPHDEFLIPTAVTAKGKGVTLVGVKYPPARDLKVSFADKPVSVFEGEVKAELNFKVDENASSGTQAIAVEAEYQSCDDKTCMPPTTAEATQLIEISGEEKKSAPATTTPAVSEKTPSQPTGADPSTPQTSAGEKPVAATRSQQNQSHFSWHLPLPSSAGLF